MQEKLENDFSTFPCSTLFGVAVYSDTAISVLGKLNQVFASLHSPNYILVSKALFVWHRCKLIEPICNWNKGTLGII